MSAPFLPSLHSDLPRSHIIYYYVIPIIIIISHLYSVNSLHLIPITNMMKMMGINSGNNSIKMKTGDGNNRSVLDFDSPSSGTSRIVKSD